MDLGWIRRREGSRCVRSLYMGQWDTVSQSGEEEQQGRRRHRRHQKRALD